MEAQLVGEYTWEWRGRDYLANHVLELFSNMTFTYTGKKKRRGEERGGEGRRGEERGGEGRRGEERGGEGGEQRRGGERK